MTLNNGHYNLERLTKIAPHIITQKIKPQHSHFSPNNNTNSVYIASQKSDPTTTNHSQPHQNNLKSTSTLKAQITHMHVVKISKNNRI
jgi:hypothetical protein